VRPFAVSVVGRDRPGIVAALAEVLLEHRVNIEDSRMSILRGHLAMTLVIAVPDEVEAGALEDGLERVRERLELESVSLAEVAELEPQVSSEPTHIVSVYGVDHPGIVHAVSGALAERGWNITDMSTRLVAEDADTALYAMMLEVALDPGASTEALEQALAPVARAEGVEVTSRPLERDVL
jgi:glycine cleavage system transcriptional repressor